MTRTRSAAIAPVDEQPHTRLPSMRAYIHVRAADDDEVPAQRGAPTDADLKVINALARARMTADELYVFDAAPSNNQLDAYYTRMAPSTLKNFARDAKAGVPIMNSHRTGGWWTYDRDTLELPVGRSYRGVIEKAGELQTFHSSAYMVRGITISDVSNDDLIRAIDAGTIFDVSIGYMGGWLKCGICNRNIRDEKCDHYPGYPLSPDTDERAWAWIEDAGLLEWSLVYSGATPGAMIEKARQFASEGRFSPTDLDEIEDRLGVRIRPSTLAVPVVTRTTPPVTVPQERTQDMTPAELIAALLADDQLSAESRAALDTLRTQADASATDVAAALTPLLRTAVSSVDVAEVTRLQERVSALEPQAADGVAYREQLITDTLAAGVRAHGAEFQQSRWERLLREPARSLADIRAFLDDFDKAATARLGTGGRKTGALDPQDPLGLGATDAEPRRRNLNVYSAP